MRNVLTMHERSLCFAGRIPVHFVAGSLCNAADMAAADELSGLA